MKHLNKAGASKKYCCGCKVPLLCSRWGNWAPADRRQGRYLCRGCGYKQRTKTVTGRLSRALQRARSRARSRGLLGTVTLRDLLPLPTVCPLLGIPLHYGPDCVPGKATFDRIDANRGYVPGNVWIVSARANTIKSDASLAELKKLTANLEFHTVFS